MDSSRESHRQRISENFAERTRKRQKIVEVHRAAPVEIEGRIRSPKCPGEGEEVVEANAAIAGDRKG